MDVTDVTVWSGRYGFQLADRYDRALVGNPQLLEGGEWVAEEKYDGEMVMWLDGRFVNRRGRDITSRFPEAAPSIKTVVLVGELVVFEPDGRSSLNKVQMRQTDNPLRIRVLSKTIPATFVVFDILEVAGGDISVLTFRERRACLRQWAVQRGLRIPEQSPVRTGADVEALLGDMRSKEREGLMLKDLNAPYETGRGRAWLKVKCWNEMECPVLRHEVTENEGFVIVVGLPDGQEQRVVVNGRDDQAAIRAGSGLRAEVQYLYVTESGRLRHPTFKRLAPVA